MFFMGVLKHVLLVCALKHVLKHDNLGLNISFSHSERKLKSRRGSVG